MRVLRTIGRRAWDAACAASLLAGVVACLLWARAAAWRGAAAEFDRPLALAAFGRYVSVTSHGDGLALLTVGGWPGGADVYGPARLPVLVPEDDDLWGWSWHRVVEGNVGTA